MIKKTSDGIVYILLSVLMLMIVSTACNLPGNDQSNLTLNPRAEDGSVSGSYSSGVSSDKLNFSVTKDGFATFHIEGAPDTEILTVNLDDEQTANIVWNGFTFDGFGALNNEGKTTLDNLMNNDLAHGLVMIPLDIGCQGEDEIDPKQVAALLVPLQMRFKYQITERRAEVQKLIALSQCDYEGGNEDVLDSLIMISRASPVPVVFGYFPFDVDGAVEPPMSSSNGLKTACLSSFHMDAKNDLSLLKLSDTNLKPNYSTNNSEFGPCEAMCRGACGPDCDPRNCRQEKELRCEKDADGSNTGWATQYLIYDCGLHQGCIEHDNCYDGCNQEYGCDSWGATHCMHGVGVTNFFDGIHFFCDQKAIEEYGLLTTNDWRRGWGPKEKRETFEYLDTGYEKQQDIEKCAIVETNPLPQGDEGEDNEQTESEGKNNVPVGTYIAEIYVNDEPPPGGDDWEYEFESDFTIQVANDGTVTGFKIYKTWVESMNPGCATRSEEGYTTNVSGFLEGNQGSAILEDKGWNFWEYHGNECGDGKDYFRDEEGVREATITVSGNQMEISYQGQVIYTLTKE